MGQPLSRHNNAIVSLEFFNDFSRFPVPEPEISCRVPRGDVLSIRRETRFDGVPSNNVSAKVLFVIGPDFVSNAVDKDLIVKRREGEPFFYTYVNFKFLKRA